MIMCDKCIKKSVCKLNHGFDMFGCIEFCQSHAEVLKEIRGKINECKRNSGGEPNRELAFNVCLKIIDGAIKKQKESK